MRVLQPTPTVTSYSNKAYSNRATSSNSATPWAEHILTITLGMDEALDDDNGDGSGELVN